MYSRRKLRHLVGGGRLAVLWAISLSIRIKCEKERTRHFQVAENGFSKKKIRNKMRSEGNIVQFN